MDQIWLQEIEILLQNGRKEDAISIIEKQASLTSENPYIKLANALIFYYYDNPSEAIALTTEALKIVRSSKNKLAKSSTLRIHANVLQMLYRYKEALDSAKASLDAARAAKSKLAEAFAWESQANALSLLNMNEEALLAANTSVSIANNIGNKFVEACAFIIQASALWRLDRYTEALQSSNAAITAAQAIGAKVAEADAQIGKIYALLMLNRDEEAFQAANKSIEIARIAGIKWTEAIALSGQSTVLKKLNRYEDAFEAANASLVAARATGSKKLESVSLNNQVSSLLKLKQYEEALKAANASVEAALTTGDKLVESNALYNQANVLLSLNRNEAALQAADTSFAAARDSGAKHPLVYALVTKSTALRILARYDEALEVANTAIQVSQTTGHNIAKNYALNNKVAILSLLNRNDEALQLANVSVETAHTSGNKLAEANALYGKANILRLLGQNKESLNAAHESFDLAKDSGDKQVMLNALKSIILSSGSLGLTAERSAALAELARIDPIKAKRLATSPSKPEWFLLVQGILKRKKERESELRKIFHAEATDPIRIPDGFYGGFVVLRKWASYTPIDLMRPKGKESIPHQNQQNTGGGYFLWWGNWGLVIDPGLGFGKNFREAGFVPRNISAVVATHHHIDHTGDMLPLLTCLFEMNQDLPTNSTQHQVDCAFSPSVFSAFSDVVSYIQGVRSVQLLRVNESTSYLLPGLDKRQALLSAISAEHKDLTGRNDASIGLRIELPSENGEKCIIGISGDTRLVEDSALGFKNVDLMIVHIGSIYEWDLGDGDQPWHLGFSGVVQLLQAIKKISAPTWDPLVLISEWGEELCPERTIICEEIKNETGITRVFPAESLQSIALKGAQAKPICAWDDRMVAEQWLEDEDGNIKYICYSHCHGGIQKRKSSKL